MLNTEYLCKNKYSKDLLGQVICNNLLCSTADIYTKYGIKIRYKRLIFKRLQNLVYNINQQCQKV